MLKFLFVFASILSTIYASQTTLTTLKLKDKTVITNCDQELKNFDQRRCYLKEARKPKLNFYFLTAKIVDGSIKKRMSFKDDKRLIVPNYVKCFYKSGQDRGHLLPDASFDYNKTLLKTTYLTSNIVPERPHVNRVLIAKIERKFRKIIDKYKSAYIITGGHYIYINKFKFNPNNKYHLNCGYYPDYIYKIIWYGKNYNKYEAYKITNVKPYKIIKLNQIQFIKLLKENNITIQQSHLNKLKIN